MRITVRGKNMDVPAALREYAERKLSKLDKFFDNDLQANVKVSIEKERHIVEVTMPLNGMLVRGEEEAQDLFTAVDKVMDKLYKQIDRYKTRIIQQRQRTVKTEARPTHTDDTDAQLVRVKRFSLKPMCVDEAIMQMNLVGHDFFVFRDADSENTAVVYRRKDGNYGLLAPE